MKFSTFTKLLEQINQETGSLKKTELVKQIFLKNIENSWIHALLLNSQIFSARSKSVLGVSDNYLIKAINKTTGAKIDEIKNLWREKGDLGIVLKSLLNKENQTNLMQKDYTTKEIIQELRKIPQIEGKDSVKQKVELITKLLSNQNPNSANYLIKIILGNLRIGVSKGIIRDGLSQAFNVEKLELQKSLDYNNDLETLTKTISNPDFKKLEPSKAKINRPITSMLYPSSKDLKESMEKIGTPVFIDIKYDGIRAQIHKNEKNIIIFTRNMDEITKQFPDVVKLINQQVKTEKVILDTELVAVDKKGNYLPFQEISKRIKRKHNIEKVMEEIKVKIFAFDLLLLNDDSLVEKEFQKRRDLLKTIIQENNEISLSDSLITSDLKEAESFYKKSLTLGEEGVMVKNLKSKYQPGRRVGAGVKIKPILEPLDVIITGGIWGEGKRSNWISSFLISINDEKNEKFLQIGKIATGLNEKQFSELTQKIKPIILKTTGRHVIVKPEIVIEVGYELIQKSLTYSSGYALRFPRLVRERFDKKIYEADDLNKVTNIYEKQRK